jgi:ABC-type microcin C transport system permease subunit YejE
MKKLLVLTFVLNFLLGSNGFAASQMTTKEDKIVNAIHKAAIKNDWTHYVPSVNNGTQTLYFKKKIKNKDYYTYRFQNRHKNKKMTVYAKVDYSQNNVNVEFVDKIRMNPGRLGIDNKVDNVLNELADAIELELSSNS